MLFRNHPDVTMSAGNLFLGFMLFSSGVVCFGLDSNVNVTFHHNSNVITVHFDASKFNYASYKVELSMNSCLDKNKTILKQTVFSPHTGDQLIFHGPFESGLHCVLITPLNFPNKTLCNTLCQPFSHEVNIDSQELLDCNDWQADLKMNYETISDGTNQIRFRMSVERSFQSCLTSINTSLWYGAYKLCNSASGYEVDLKTVEVVPALETVAVFSNLRPGNYCIRLQFSHSSCHGPCKVMRTGLLNIPNVTSEAVGALPSTSNAEGSSLIYILCGCVIFLLIIVGASTFYCKKVNTRFPSSGSEKGLNFEELISLAKERAQKLEIVLIYSPDFEEHCDAVAALCQFLLKSFGVSSVRYDKEEEALILVNLTSWVESVITPKPNRVFIIVESEGAVLQEDGRRKVKLVRPKNQDSLDDVFPYALQLLKSETRGLCDYRTVFVVKFKYSPDDLLLKCFVPNRRYTVPKHLFDLYCGLLDLPQPSVEVFKKFEDRMRKEWQGRFQKDLFSGIEKVSQKISSKPDIVQESFVEYDLVSYV